VFIGKIRNHFGFALSELPEAGRSRQADESSQTAGFDFVGKINLDSRKPISILRQN
jgi:hypothetical protein